MTNDKALARKAPASAMTRKQAMYLLTTIYPRAPVSEVIKAAIICAQYHLNPLMRQVYLVPFSLGTPKESWAVVMGIKAARQIAGRDHRYSYADGPRVMTEAEQVVILGSADPARIWAVTILKDDQGNMFPGYGWWPHDSQPYGEDKGNSKFNMAFIRSERNALDKLAPGALPELETADATYAPINIPAALAEGEKQFIKQAKMDIEDLYGPAED